MTVEAVAVVVPARDEEQRLPACLSALRAAAARLHRRGIPVHVTVVADACRDRTARLARRLLHDADAAVLTVDHASAGRARAAGLRHARVVVGPVGWLATTDADTRVPARWLEQQVAYAGRGWHALAGRVRVDDWSDRDPTIAARYAAVHRGDGVADGHAAVHGANLGMSAAAYDRSGGLPPLPLAEDHALWQSLRRTGLPIRAVADLVVTTSARRSWRAPGGFSSLLDSLERGSDAPAA